MQHLFLFILILIGQGLFLKEALCHFYDRKAEGWHWYEDLKKKESEKNASIPSHLDPVEQLSYFKEKVERLKAVAVLHPTYHNVKAYMEIQKELMERSGRFAKTWLEVLYTTPHLDYTLDRPTSQVGRHVYLREEKEKIEGKIRSLSQSHGLFFFYSGRCPYCKEFAGIVKSFSHKYQWEVLPISLDGEILPEFPETRKDNGAALTLKIRNVPTLLAIEPHTKKIIPLSYGLSTHDQIEDRVRVLLLGEKS